MKEDVELLCGVSWQIQERTVNTMGSINNWGTMNGLYSFWKTVIAGIISSLLGGTGAGIILYYLFRGTEVYNTLSSISEKMVK